MERIEINLIKRLFNTGKLTMKDAEFYYKQGYSIVCGDGAVQEMSLPIENILALANKLKRLCEL